MNIKQNIIYTCRWEICSMKISLVKENCILLDGAQITFILIKDEQ